MNRQQLIKTAILTFVIFLGFSFLIFKNSQQFQRPYTRVFFELASKSLPTPKSLLNDLNEVLRGDSQVSSSTLKYLDIQISNYRPGSDVQLVTLLFPFDENAPSNAETERIIAAARQVFLDKHTIPYYETEFRFLTRMTFLYCNDLLFNEHFRAYTTVSKGLLELCRQKILGKPGVATDDPIYNERKKSLDALLTSLRASYGPVDSDKSVVYETNERSMILSYGIALVLSFTLALLIILFTRRRS